MASHAVGRLDPDILLANAGWVRALALRLVHDEAGADDVVQDTLTAAVARPPHGSVPLAPWLARVARNFSLRLLRSGRRRRERETQRLRAEPAPSVEESAARTEMFHEVVGAVLALEPLYRDIVVQRFFEGLDLRQVAERLGIPHETARSRLRRALALLRARLDAKYGARSTWAVALLPLGNFAPAAGATTATTVTTVVTTGPATTIGGTLMAASTKAVVGATLTGAILGGALIFAVGPRLDSSSPPERAGSAVAEARPELLGGAPEAGDSALAAPGPRLEGSPATPTSLAAALRTVHVDLPPPLSGTITGHVTSKAGAPLSGVVVRAWIYPPGTWSRRRAHVPPQRSVEERLQETLRSASWDMATRRETRTDAEGAFAFRDLLDASYNLGAWADGLLLRMARGSEGTVRPGGSVDFVGESVVVLPVKIVMPDGSTPKEASVSWTVPKQGGGGSGWWSLSDPMVEMEPGDWTITAEVRPDYRSEALAITVGDAPEGVTLHLQARNRLVGALRFDAADTGWTYATVTARRRDADASAEPLQTGVRAPDWSFRFDDLAPGEYEVSAALADSVAVASAVFDVQGSLLNQVLAVPRLTSAQFLEVRVVGPGGTTLDADDVSFSLQQRGGSTMSAFGTRSVQRADGTFLIPLETRSTRARAGARRASGAGGAGSGGAARGGAPGGLPETLPEDAGAVEYSLRVESKTHGTRDLPYVPGSIARLEVVFP